MESMACLTRILAAAFLALAAWPLQAAALILTTEESPPYNMQEGAKVIGIATDKVRELMARAGQEHRIDLLPWKRAYDLALNQADTCVYSTTRTAERESLFKWVGPVAASEWVMFARADRRFDLKSLDDARSLRIGTYNGDVRDAYLRSRGFQVDTATDDVTNPKKLMASRIDLWASGRFEGQAILKQNGWATQVVPVLAFNRADLYLACNRSVPDALIDRLNATLATMGRDGTTKAVERRYERWPN